MQEYLGAAAATDKRLREVIMNNMDISHAVIPSGWSQSVDASCVLLVDPDVVSFTDLTLRSDRLFHGLASLFNRRCDGCEVLQR